MSRRVAVTGLGCISAIGANVPAMLAALRAGRCGIGSIRGFSPERLTVGLAAEIESDPAAHFSRRQLLVLDRATQIALLAAREAMAGAGAGAAGFDPERAGVVMAGTVGQTTMEAGYHALYAENAARLPPMTIPRSMTSAAASHLAMEFGLLGPCFAVASACASSAHALGLAFHMVRAGTLDLALAGGADASITLGYLKAWDGLRVLSNDACRPFSADRTGLVIGEGAGVLVLEAWEHAQARGATIHAELLGFGMSADAADLTAPSADGAARAIAGALRDGGVKPERVGYVNAHGTGTRLNDRVETAALRSVFGDHMDAMPVSSTKSMHGHCLNAAGGVEAVATVLALRERFLPPTIGYRQADPECTLDCVPNVAREAGFDVALSNSFAFGGLNAVLAMGRA